MKPVYFFICVLGALFIACDDSEKLSNQIDFSSPYVIEDGTDPIQHRRYELYRDYGVSVFFSDTISRTYVGEDFLGNPIYRYETIDLNWEFTSHSNGSMQYSFDYLFLPEQQSIALDFAENFLRKATGAMRPFCMFLTDTLKVANLASETIETPNYLNNFRTLVIAQVTGYASVQMDSLSTVVLRSMVKSRVLKNANLVARFGAVSSTDNYYSRHWVNDGSNDGLGVTCRWMTGTDGYTAFRVNTCFDEQTVNNCMATGLFASVEEFEDMRAEMLADIGRFGFISGWATSSKVYSPNTVDEDLGYFIDTMLEIGKEEFVNRYGGSELVMEKYEILVDYIEGELGVKI